jgi:2-keto-4-pentenoate hydratase/2-oxohepta-3-ene-1,7-dioic acid hydratase in catechol pathway
VRLVTYDAGAGPRVGVLEGDGVADVGFDGDMVAFIAAGAEPATRTPVDGPVRLLAPLRPRSMRDFLAFEGHMKAALTRLGRDVPDEWYEVPAYYKGMPDTVIGPEDEIPWPGWTDHLDHELELAAVIGPAPVRDLDARDAVRAVFGWTIWNDLSARDVQAAELPIGMGPGKAKDWDGSNVLGPCIVTADEIDASDLRMAVRINGETWGDASTAEMHHSFGVLLAYASRSQTLHPGEVIGSGTAPGGSGIELDRRLAPGDVIEMEIEGIGLLRNTIGAKGT